MFCFPLTNWTTMRGASTVTSITQSESQWLDLRGFEDIIAWLEVKNVTLGGAASVSIAYQTSPTKDEALYTPVVAAIAMTAGTVTVTKGLMSAANVPLARWLRWQLTAAGPTSSWDATFRVWIAANIGPHPLRPRIQAPPLRQNGKSCNGDCQNGGSMPVNLPGRPSPQGGPPGLHLAGKPGANIGPHAQTRYGTAMQNRPVALGPKYLGPTPR